MSAKRAEKHARRKARAAKRAVARRRPQVDSLRESSNGSELEALLLRRGWTLFDRAPRRAMYDWPPSFDSADGEVTYLMIDEVDPRQIGRYRVSCVDGERRTYGDEDSLIADLDEIEARRA